MSNNVHYNFDLEQCNWLFKQGIHGIGVGKHEVTQNPVICFQVSKKYKDACKFYDENVRNK